MAIPVNPDAVTQALGREVATAWSANVAPASAADGAVQNASGWLVTIPASGVATGTLSVWFDAAAAADAAKRQVSPGTEPGESAILQLLTVIAGRAADAVVATPDGAGLTCGQPAVTPAMPPPGSHPFALSYGDGLVCQFAVMTGLGAAAPVPPLAFELNDSRLDAVLEVDLPLVVRFGRAVMPLRSVAELSPGAVVDMGRSPDEPVELLVGDRLIARGEVVIVGGNYGVRITELTSGRRASDQEARS